MTTVLVTGGAGYIGSHACKTLSKAGYTPVTFDNLVTGAEHAVRFGPFEFGDLADRARLDEVFRTWRPAAVMHFAALSQVGEAVREPGKYWRGNTSLSLNLIEAALAAQCRNFIFSSTCAIYGDHDGILIDEDTPQYPLNAYGASKRAIEDMLRSFGAAHDLKFVIFRYFNVTGADPEGDIKENHDPETHLIPIILEVAEGKRKQITVFGEDYHTKDGTCIRDYIHVSDLVDAHVLGLKWLEAGKDSNVFCLGSGHGYSVREVIDHASHVIGKPIPFVVAERRPGDAAHLVSGSHRASLELGWRPKRSDLAVMIADAWNAMQKAQR